MVVPGIKVFVLALLIDGLYLNQCPFISDTKVIFGPGVYYKNKKKNNLEQYIRVLSLLKKHIPGKLGHCVKQPPWND